MQRKQALDTAEKIMKDAEAEAAKEVALLRDNNEKILSKIRSIAEKQ